MRDYAKVSPKFWIGATGKRIRTAGLEARVVATYLLTCPSANMLGLYYLPLVTIAHETGIPIEGASKALASLSEAQFCAYDEASEVIWVYEMAAYQIGEQLAAGDKQCKGIQNAYDALPESPFLPAFYEKYEHAFHLKKARGNGAEKPSPTEAPSKPLRSQEQEQEIEQEQEQDSGRAREPRREGKGKPLAAPRGTDRPDPHDQARRELVAKCQAVYPRGTYSAVDWITFEREVAKLLDEDEANGARILASCEAFRAQCQATGKIGTQYVRSPAKHLVEGHWRHELKLPVDPKAEALAAWTERVLPFVRRGMTGPTPGGKVDEVVRQVGGYVAIGATDNSKNPAYRNRFVQLWPTVQVAEVAA
jgi:hypothetical protein